MDSFLVARFRSSLEIAGLMIAARYLNIDLREARLEVGMAESLFSGVGRRVRWLSDVVELKEPLGLRAHLLAMEGHERQQLFSEIATVVLAGREALSLGDPFGLLHGAAQEGCRQRLKACLDSFGPTLNGWQADLTKELPQRATRILGRRWADVVLLALKLYDKGEIGVTDLSGVSPITGEAVGIAPS